MFNYVNFLTTRINFQFIWKLIYILFVLPNEGTYSEHKNIPQSVLLFIFNVYGINL